MTDDDQIDLVRDTARRLLAERFSMSDLRAMIDTPPVRLDRPAWSAIADRGWLGACIDEAFGGLGLPASHLCVLAEEMGRALAPLPFNATTGLFAPAIERLGSDDQKAHWLPRVATGKVAATLATSEGAGFTLGQTLRTRWRSGGLFGAKLPVLDGMTADTAIVLARDGRGQSLFVVDLAGPGVKRRVVQTIDPTRPAAHILLDGCPGERLGRAGDGFDQLEALLVQAAVPLAFEQIGGARRCLEMAVAYAGERYAFGRPIGSFQAIKHKLADLYMQIEIARLNADHAARALDQGAPDLAIAAAAARIAASEAYWTAAKENIQVHGGMGFTWEMDCHLFYRRSKLLAVTADPAVRWKDRLAAQLLEAA